MMTYDHGGWASNPFGHFPIFQCSPMDKKSSCKQGDKYSTQPTFENGQYCLFEYRQNCLNFKGYSFDKKLMEYDTCKDFHKVEE